MLDPGIGFGKTVEHNLELLRRLDELVAIGRPVVIGTLAQVVPRPAHRSRRRRSAARRRSPRTCSRTSAARGCSGSTTSRRSHDALDGGGCYGQRPMDGRRRRVRRGRRGGRRRRGHPEPEVTIEISGLSLFTHVGVTAAEREVGQRLLLDLRIDVGECDATVTDRIEDTVDYAPGLRDRQPGRPAALVQDARAAVRRDRRPRCSSSYDAARVWVKAAKPEPPLALPVSEVSVEVWREAE